jgi:hypothetical protein
MALAADIGRRFTLTLTDGRVIETRLTFGDFARAELDSGTNYLTAIATQGDIGLADIARLCYQAAIRTGQYAGSFDEWLTVLDGFPDIHDDEQNGEVAAPVPFPEAVPATS